MVDNNTCAYYIPQFLGTKSDKRRSPREQDQWLHMEEVKVLRPSAEIYTPIIL